MSKPLEIDGAPACVASQALDILRGRPNPFENLVRPQRPDERFLDVHVPELLHEPRELLLKVIDTYRLVEYHAVSDLPDSRVVTILGRRGLGKTHLAEAVANRDDGRRQLLVRPLYYEPDVSFDEYLLAQIVNAFLTEDPIYGGRPFDAIALAITRRLLRQALVDLGPVERLMLAPPSGWMHYRLLWSGGEPLAARVDQLLAGLGDLPTASDIAALAVKNGFQPHLLVRLIDDHVKRWERGDDALPAIRRQLLPGLARAALLEETDAFTQFLEGDYTPAGARPFYRAEIVRQLLVALVEVCALVRLPVVFAFDNLEGLLAPQGQVEPSRVRALFDSLGQAIDSSRGLLFLLFAEEELNRSIRKEVNAFALNRIDQGVPVHGRGPVDVIQLQPPSAEELGQLITGRVTKLLRNFANSSMLPRAFPFETAFINDLEGRSSLELRNKLLRLRDEYSRVVYNRPAPKIETGPEMPDWSAELTRCWSEKLTAATRRLHNRELVTLYHDLHAGLRQLLQQAGTWESNGLEFAAVQPMNTTDGHGTYSQVTIVDWRTPGTNGEAAPACRVCVGLLVAGARGMPRDLKAKFAPLPDTTHPPDKTAVLWPAPAEQELPTATREAWDKNFKRYHATLHRLSDEDVHKLLALPDWVKELRGKTDQVIPESALRGFIRDKCNVLLSLVAPAEEGKANRNAN